MKPFSRLLPAVAAVWAMLTLSSAALSPSADSVADRFARDVATLAADDMEGRGLGTKGLDRAADWIESRLRALKLEPAFAGSYRQPFDVKIGVALEPGNALSGVAEGDWSPLGFSSAGAFSGEIAFVGYGIEAAPLDYRELSGVDLKGKVALMLRYEPQEKDDASKFDGRRPSRWSAPRYKVLQARERGAVAVVFVDGPLQDEGKDKLPALRNDGPESPAGIPVLQVRLSVARKWLSGDGISLDAFQKSVDSDLKPRSTGATGVRLDGRVALRASYAKAANLAGVIPGRGALAKEVVVIGAHYDHLGYGGAGSMKPNTRAIHHGADDNASGTAAVLLAARKLTADLASQTNRRTVVFALFSGEEVGLAGSSWLVAHPPFPFENVKAMVNLDMVGALQNDELIVLGTESAKEWAAAIAPLGEEAGLKILGRGDGYGPSDQTSFYAKQVPVLHFFTGTHIRYHTPEDTADAINAAGGAKVIDFTARVGEALALGRVTPLYARSAAAPPMEGDRRGYGSYLGTVPDFKAMEATEGGVLLSDVRTGGPADLAGIRGGDRILAMAGTKIANLYDMTYALEDHKPGETIDVVVERGGEKKTLRATLGERRAAPDQAGAPQAASSPSPRASAGTTPASAAWSPRAGKPFEKSFDGERHLADVRQLTFGGENAEAYFSPDGRKVIYQATPRGASCDQEYVLDLSTGDSQRVSDGKGRTTCGYFRYPQGDRIVYSSTRGGGDACPPVPDRSKGYVWPIYDTYDIWTALPDGSSPRLLMKSPGYDAEATWNPMGGRIVFTSDRDGDLDLYEMDEEGKNVRRLTTTPGYDGGAFYSPDGSEIVWRASRPEGAELAEYRALLKQGLIRPTKLDIYAMKADGTKVRRLTDNGAANFCPLFTADGKKVMWSSNVGDPKGREFDLWMVDNQGGTPEKVTTAPGFDGFPHFSPDGKWIVWASNRADPASHETNLFIARWLESMQGQ
ncbi:MAG: M28 family peptidase [Acidobacteriota bacterium]